MSFYLYDTRGYVGDGPTTTGLNRLTDWAAGQHPAIEAFLYSGVAEDVPALVRALEAATADGPTEAARQALLQAAKQAQDVLLLGTGIVTEADEEELRSAVAASGWPLGTEAAPASEAGADARSAADFDESLHPRDERGRFAPKGSGSGPSGMTTIGMRKPTPEEAKVEHARQQELHEAQTNPLAHPMVIFGYPDRFGPNGARHDEAMRYVGAYGREFPGPAVRPKKSEMGEPNECFKNCSLLLVNRDDLEYVEGFAYPFGGDLAVLHAWCVTKDGQVIDPTPTMDPKTTKYFGVQYDRQAYMKSMFKQKFYGMIGADDRTSRLVVDTGAKGIRKETA